MSLDQIVPDGNIRKWIYRVFGAVGLVMGAIQVGFASTPDASQPGWLTVALAVYAFMGAAGFTVSQANTPTQPSVPVVDDGEDVSEEYSPRYAK